MKKISSIHLSKLKEIRKKKKVTQEYIASQIDMDRTNYCKKEQGIIPITLDEFIAICDVLEVSPLEILDDTPSKVITNNDLEMLEMLKKIGISSKEVLEFAFKDWVKLKDSAEADFFIEAIKFAAKHMKNKRKKSY